METNERVIHSLSVKRQTGRWNTDCADDADTRGSVKIRPIRVIRVLFDIN